MRIDETPIEAYEGYRVYHAPSLWKLVPGPLAIFKRCAFLLILFPTFVGTLTIALQQICASGAVGGRLLTALVNAVISFAAGYIAFTLVCRIRGWARCALALDLAADAVLKEGKPLTTARGVSSITLKERSAAENSHFYAIIANANGVPIMLIDSSPNMLSYGSCCKLASSIGTFLGVAVYFAAAE